MNPKLKELRGKLKDRKQKLHQVFEEAGGDVDFSKVSSLDGDTDAKVASVRAMNKEIDELATELEPLEAEHREIEKAQERAREFQEESAGHPLPRRASQAGEGEGGNDRIQIAQSLGEIFIESEAGTTNKGDDVFMGDVDMRATLFETGAGWTPENIRTGRIVDKAVRPIQVIDVIPGGSTSQNAVVFMEETLFTNNAGEVGEGDEYKEVALGLEEKTSPVRKITAWLPVTDEQLEDVPQAQSYINNRLPFMVRQRLDGQIVTGTGEGDNLRGFLNTEGVQTQAKGADPVPDAIYKAMVNVEVTGQAMQGPVIIHPKDWQDIRLLRTADGIYIWGSPSEAGPERIWGQRVVKAQSITEGTALTGDFANFSELAMRKGLNLKVSDSHSDFFIKGKQAIRADLRAALVVYRPAAFCAITGI